MNKRVALVLAVALLAQGAGRADSHWRRRVVDLTRLDVLNTVQRRYAHSISADATAFTIFENNVARIIDARDGRELQVLAGHEAMVHDSCWSRDGRLVATTGYDETVRIWESATGKPRIVLRPFTGFACSAAFSPDGRWLAAGSGTDGQIKIVDAVTGAKVRDLQTPDTALFAMEFTPDGRFLVVNHTPENRAGSSIRVYKVSDCTEVKTAIAGPSNAFAVSRDGSRFAYGNAAGSIVLLETAAWTELTRIPAHLGNVTGLSFHPDGRYLASSGNDGAVRLWDTSSGKSVNTLAIKNQMDSKVSFSGDGETLVVGTSDAVVKLYGRRVPVSEEPKPAPADPAGK